MKTLIKKILLIFILSLSIHTITFAGNTVPFFYNLMPIEDSLSIIDCNSTLGFELWEEESKILVNGIEVNVIDNYFEIDITDLFGEQEFVISNDKGEDVTLKYYISNKNGLIEGYRAEDFENYDIFVTTTIDNIKIIYSEKDVESVEKILNCLENMPTETKINLKEIKLLPKKSRGNIAGVTNYDKITFYGLSKYDNETQENIIYHEIAHTWAYELIREKVLDFSYTNYKEIVELDNNFVSNYSKKAIKNSDDYSEDFAESIAFFFINTESFEEKYPARTEFILSILD